MLGEDRYKPISSLVRNIVFVIFTKDFEARKGYSVQRQFGSKHYTIRENLSNLHFKNRLLLFRTLSLKRSSHSSIFWQLKFVFPQTWTTNDKIPITSNPLLESSVQIFVSAVHVAQFSPT